MSNKSMTFLSETQARYILRRAIKETEATHGKGCCSTEEGHRMITLTRPDRFEGTVVVEYKW